MRHAELKITYLESVLTPVGVKLPIIFDESASGGYKYRGLVLWDGGWAWG
jgi:hypothetical protein